MTNTTTAAQQLTALRDLRDERQRTLIDLAHREFAHVLDARLAGATWQEIGSALGMSGQAVHKKYAPTSTRP